MSVSGILRMELGDYIKFEPSMLPKNILSTEAKQKTQNPIQKNEIEERNKKADSIGINAEEFIQIFNMAQEARVKELEETMNLNDSDDNGITSNPFSNN